MKWVRSGPYVVESTCGKFKIAKYGSSPIYGLFWLSPVTPILFSDDLDKIKAAAVVEKESRSDG